MKNELTGWKWVTRERQPIFRQCSNTFRPYEVGVWIKRRPGAGPFTVFSSVVDAFQFGATLGTDTIDLWEVRWVPCYHLDGPKGVEGMMVLWYPDPVPSYGGGVKCLPEGTCLAEEFKLVRVLPRDEVLQGIVDTARLVRQRWSRRLIYWLAESRKQKGGRE
jgi:hypothetical protein